MDQMHAHITAGANAADARARVRQQNLGYGWQTVTAPCEKSAIAANSFMATTGNKRPPRRLGQRST